MRTKLLIFILLVGLLTACGSQPTDAPASLPTEEPATSTQASPPASTDTSMPPSLTPPATQTPAQTKAVSFSQDILPLIKNRCWNCHGGNRTEEGLVLSSYEGMIKGSDNGLVVIAGNPDESLLVELLVNQKMPKRGPKLTSPQIQLIVDWINQGAQNN